MTGLTLYKADKAKKSYALSQHEKKMIEKNIFLAPQVISSELAVREYFKKVN